MRYCINCGPSVAQCQDPFSSRWCHLSFSRGWTTAMRHWSAFHHISCHGCSQWWTPLLDLFFLRWSFTILLRSCISFIGWRLQSGLHWNMQSSCTSVSTGLHLLTSSTNFVKWQMSRLVGDSVPVDLRHWLSAIPDCLPSVTELFRSLLLVSGTVSLIMSRLHLPYLSSGRDSKPTCLTFHTLPPCDCTVPAQWHLVTLVTLIVLAYLLTYLLTIGYVVFRELVIMMLRCPHWDNQWAT